MLRQSNARTSWLALTVCLLSLVAGGGDALAQVKAKRAEISKTALSRTALPAGGEATLAVVLEIAPGFHAQSHTPSEPQYVKFVLKLNEHPDLEFGEPIYPAGKDEEYPALGKLNVYTGKVVVRVPVKAKSTAAAGTTQVTGKLTYQICDDKVCYISDSPKFSVDVKIVATGEATQPNEPELFDQPTKEAAAPLDVKIFGRDLNRDAYFLAFAAAFLVGIIFNVMPCVLPVVPLKAIGFYEVSQHNRAKSIAFGAVFSAGLIASFAVLGLLVVALRVVDWGQLFTIPWFRLAIVLILIVMAVSTFGVFTVNVPTALYSVTPRHDTYVGNFLFGILTAVLSTPCTFGMFVGLLTWAVAQPPIIGMLLLVMVGVGMAFPYFILSAFPELARRFPRTGPWAELVKQMMGFLLLGTAVYFARPFLAKWFGSDVFWWLLFAVVAAAGVHLTVRTLRFTKKPLPRLIAVAVALSLVAPAFLAARQLTFHPYDWQPYSKEWSPDGPAFLAAAAAGKPVLFEFTADWCGNCHALEALVLNNRGVAAAVKESGVVMVKADVTEGDAPARELLNKLNPVGAIPLTAIYSPHQSKPTLLTGIYSKDDLKAAVRSAARPAVALP